MSLTTEIAIEMLRSYPRSISNQLVNSAKFRKKIDLNGIVIPQFRAGRIKSWDLFDIVRKVFNEKEEKQIRNLDGKIIRVFLKDEKVVLGCTEKKKLFEDFSIIEFDLLSLDPKTRIDAFKALIKGVGPTGTDFDSWQKILKDGPLSNIDLESLFESIGNSVSRFEDSVYERMDQGKLNLDNLIPKSIKYYTSLCGRLPNDKSVSEYIKIFNEHRAKLIKRDLYEGFRLCLGSNLSPETSLVPLLNDHSDKAVWKLLNDFSEVTDPFSILSLLEVALSRRGKGFGFEDFSINLIEKLCDDELKRKDGVDVYIYYPALVLFCFNRIRMLKGMINQPPYWHFLCAFIHAGVINRTLEMRQFDVNSIAEWLNEPQLLKYSIADCLALRKEPMWRSENLSRSGLQAEIFGRLNLIATEEAKNKRKFPNEETLIKKIQNLISHGVYIHKPGPLEGHLRPDLKKEKEDDLNKELKKKLNSSIEEFPWGAIDSISSIEPLSMNMRSLIVEKIPTLTIDRKSVKNQYPLFFGIALTTSIYKDKAMASALCDLLIRKIDEIESKNNLPIVFLIASTAIEESEWQSWVNNYFFF
ncbi:MAG: hypothetical protein PF503_08805, partial [Desulfobacula sp.]|nr:hypothetical protein [Desulfobacula sp.]